MGRGSRLETGPELNKDHSYQDDQATNPMLDWGTSTRDLADQNSDCKSKLPALIQKRGQIEESGPDIFIAQC